MTTYEFLVIGTPVPQPRARFAIATRRMYVPKKHPVWAYKAAVVEEFRGQYPKHKPITGPVEIYADFVFPRQSTAVWKTKPMPRYRHTTKNADIDNCWKSLTDALNKIAYNDDCQIVVMGANKWRAEGSEDPHTRVIIRELPNES